MPTPVPPRRAAFVLTWLMASAAANAGGPVLVDKGRPRAEIVIADQPTRSVRLAAHELQTGLQKITGARLPIVTAPSEGVPVQVFVGRSAFTERRGVTDAGLEHGAYRMVSGDSWLVLIGRDADFRPTEPWARRHRDIASGALAEAWRDVAGVPWGVPQPRLYKHRLVLPGPIGVPDAELDARADEPLEVWGHDERGTFNAVCGLLRRLGMRWYMPGPLGEVVPSMQRVAIERIDEVVRPDFAVRRFNFRFAVVGAETALWAMRLGLRDPFGLQVAHGLSTMTQHPEAFEQHPEWFALYGDKRDNEAGPRTNQLCLSHQGLFENTVRLVRAQLEQYPLQTVSVMPPDGFTKICQCPLCHGKAADHGHPRGALSDYVWGFVNRVAREVKKTHPHRKVLNCAYGVYSQPPPGIEKLESNVALCIVGARRPFRTGPEARRALRKLVKAWSTKTDGPLLVFENYPFTDRGTFLPAFSARAIGASVNAMKGQSMGEDVWLSAGRDFATRNIGFNHFIVYFTARMYWGGATENVDALLEDYARRFYGPAADEMLAFFRYAEDNWPRMERELAPGERALVLFQAAKARVPASSVYGQRLAFIDAFLDGLRNKVRQLGQPRGAVPQLRLVGRRIAALTIDGRLDEDAWRHAPTASTGTLKEVQTGRVPTFGTTFWVSWGKDSLYLAVQAQERTGEPLNVTTARTGDGRSFAGDAIEVLLETNANGRYHMAVSPSGEVLDTDLAAPGSKGDAWSSKAEVAVVRADDHWTVEMRIPVTNDQTDPLHQVIGERPTAGLPWFINIGRRRVRSNGTELSAFAPTSAPRFDIPLKYARFFGGRASKTDTSNEVTDFVAERRGAERSLKRGRKEEALDAFEALAARAEHPLQQADALQQAAAIARKLGRLQQARLLVARIPIASVRKAETMENLLRAEQPSEVIASFGREQIVAWPFWARGQGHLARGQAYRQLKQGAKAERDLTQALAFIGDRRDRARAWLEVAANRELNLEDDEGALSAYRSSLEGKPALRRSEHLRAVQAMARLLLRLDRVDEAVSVLREAAPSEQRGRWRASLLLDLGAAEQAAGRTDEARKAYTLVADDPASAPRARRTAQERLHALRVHKPKRDPAPPKPR